MTTPVYSFSGRAGAYVCDRVTYGINQSTIPIEWGDSKFIITPDDLKNLELLKRIPIIEDKLNKLEYILDELRYVPEIGDIYLKVKQNFEEIQGSLR